MKKILLVTGVAVLAFASVSAAATAPQPNLTVGSTGAQVTALQTWLIANNFSIPAGATGYFGSQTKAALAAYQASVGLPAFGFYGPLTYAKLSGTAASTASMTPAAVACPAGYTCTANPGTVTTTTTTTTGTTGTTVATTGGITTPGVQGIMSVTQGPISTSVAYAGQTKIPVLDARIQAQYSDISVQSIQVDLGSSTNAYNYVYSKIYLIDPTTGNVLTSQPLNSSTVVQNGSNYVVGLAGFNFIVPKGTFKDIQVAVDLYPTVLTQFLGQITTSIDINGIRGVDGAGVNNYGPASSAISQVITVNQTQTLTATANISLDSSSPLANAVGITNVSAGSYLGLPVLTFDVNAQGDTLHLHNVSVNIGTAGSTGSPSVNAAYLYQGSTLITSAAVTCGGTTNCTANFSNIPDGTNGASVPINSTTPFTVKVDVTGPANTSFAANVIASTSGMTIYGSSDNTVSSNGVAQGNLQTVQGEGAVFSLSGTPTITKAISNQNTTNGSTTYAYTATFNVTVQAIGTTVTLGLPASSTPAFGTSSTNFVNVYENGAPVGITTYAPVVSYSQPTNTSLSSNGSSFSVGINQSVTIPVTYSFLVANPGANVFGVQLNGINSAPNGLTSFMNGLTTWRTSSI